MTNELTIEAIMKSALARITSENATPVTVARMPAEEVAALLDEIERLKADAGRYRWLKSRPVAVPADGPDLALWADCCGDELRGNEADKAIDAAMKAGS